jgi:hypothetical protein
LVVLLSLGDHAALGSVLHQLQRPRLLRLSRLHQLQPSLLHLSQSRLLRHQVFATGFRALAACLPPPLLVCCAAAPSINPLGMISKKQCCVPTLA